MSPKSALHRLKMILTLSFLTLFTLATNASASVSPPFASVETSSGISIVYKFPSDKSLWTASSTNGTTWPAIAQLPTTIGTNFAPAAVSWNGSTHVIYGSLADDTLWMTDSSNWSQLSHLPTAIKTYTTPAATVFQNKLYLVYKSTEDATILTARSDNGSTWELNHLPTTITTSASPATAIWNSRLYTFYRSAMD